MEWNEDAERQLIELFHQKLSLQQMGAALGVSHNAIAGRIFRLRKQGKLPPSPKPFVPKPQKRRLKRVPTPPTLALAVAELYSMMTVALIELSPPEPEPPPLPPEPTGITDTDDGVDYLINRGCKALLEKRGEWGLRMCCGRELGYDDEGRKSPYCDKHFRLYSQPAKQKWS